MLYATEDQKRNVFEFLKPYLLSHPNTHHRDLDDIQNGLYFKSLTVDFLSAVVSSLVLAGDYQFIYTTNFIDSVTSKFLPYDLYDDEQEFLDELVNF